MTPDASQIRALLRRHGLGLLFVLLGTGVNTCALTDGRLEFTTAESACGAYYDALGDSMLRGRWDVPPEAIGPEAFLLNGLSYGYFGPTPALVRLPLNRLVPSMRGHWTRWMMILACLFTLLGTYAVVLAARRTATGDAPTTLGQQGWDGFFVVCAALATPMFFIMRSPIIYHEASAVGVAFAIWSFVFILRYRETTKLASLVGAFLCALASFQARASVGAGPMLAVALVNASLLIALVRQQQAPERTPALPRGDLLRHAVVITLVAGLSTAAVLYKNLTVLGSLSGAPPLSHHIQLIYWPERLARTDGGHFIQPLNVRTTLANYLDPRQFQLVRAFPYFRAQSVEGLREFPETKLDHREPFASLTAINTIWCVLLLIGTYCIARRRAWARFRVPLVGAAAGVVPILIAACITERYLHDTYPLLILGAAVAFEVVLAAPGPAWRRRVALGVVIGIALFSCFTSVAVAVTMARWT